MIANLCTESVAKNRRGASVEKAENTIEVRRFTWEEVAKHNTSTDLWVTVHEKVKFYLVYFCESVNNVWYVMTGV